MRNKKYLVLAVVFITSLSIAFYTAGYSVGRTDIYIESQIGPTTGITDSNSDAHPKSDVHATIKIYQAGQLVFTEYNSGALTDLGDSWLAVKWCGDTYYNETTWGLNGTFISIGDQGTLNAASTILPGEWNRTAGTVEDQATSSFNLTCIFYPDDSGPYTADCIGINLEDGLGKNDLVAYDTFTEVTGIDETFTINIEFQITISHT
jgi:hypothetical protein